MAEEPSKTPGTSAERPSPQIIPLSKIHDLPGVFRPMRVEGEPTENSSACTTRTDRAVF